MIDCHIEVRAWPTHNPIMMDMSMTVISHVMTMISELAFVQAFNPDIYCLEWIRESLSLYHIEVRVCQPGISRWLLTRKARKAVWMRRAPHSWRFLYRCLEESIRIFSTFSVTIANFGSSLTSLKYSSSSLADSSTLLLFSADVFHSTHRRCFSPPGFFCKCHMPMELKTILLFLNLPNAIAWRSLRMYTTLTWNSLHRKVWCKWNGVFIMRSMQFVNKLSLNSSSHKIHGIISL